MDLSIIIVNWNTQDLLKQCMKSIYDTLPPAKIEIIVVDNASNDGSQEMVKKNFPRIRLIENDDNLGFSKANNQGIGISSGKYILLLNSDTRVQPRALDKMVEFMDAHPQAGIVGPKLLYPDGSHQLSGGHFPTISGELFERSKLTKLFPASRWVGKFRMTYWQRNDQRELDWVTGACLMIRRRTIDDIGLMDRNFFMHYEDIDWCYRATKRDWKVYFLPEAQVLHYEHQSSEKYPFEMHFLNYRKSQLYFYQKHYNKGRTLFLRIVTVFLMILRILFVPVEYVFVAKTRGRFLQKLKQYWSVIKMALGKDVVANG